MDAADPLLEEEDDLWGSGFDALFLDGRGMEGVGLLGSSICFLRFCEDEEIVADCPLDREREGALVGALVGTVLGRVTGAGVLREREGLEGILG